MSDAAETPESGAEMELSVFIARVLQDVVQGVLLAQGESVPVGLPSGVDFILSLENGDVEFTVPLSNYIFENKQSMVTYTYGTTSKN